MSQPFDIPEDLFKRAEAAAAGKGEPVRHFILDAILEAVEDMEDLKAAEEALERIRNGEDQYYTLDELGEFIEVESHRIGTGEKAVYKAS